MQAINQMIDHIAKQDQAIENLQAALCDLSSGKTLVDCPPPLDTERLSRMVK